MDVGKAGRTARRSVRWWNLRILGVTRVSRQAAILSAKTAETSTSEVYHFPPRLTTAAAPRKTTASLEENDTYDLGFELRPPRLEDLVRATR